MLQVHTPAPDFSLADQDGNIHSLQDYSGKKLAIYFYPKDDTPGCTAQACNLRDNISALTAAGISVVGVSVDSEKSHKKFENKFSLPFPLLADKDKKMVADYQVWGEKKFMGRQYMGTNRVTFLLDEAGSIASIIEKVDTKDHAAQILAAAKAD